jgi:hypothetical protein
VATNPTQANGHTTVLPHAVVVKNLTCYSTVDINQSLDFRMGIEVSPMGGQCNAASDGGAAQCVFAATPVTCIIHGTQNTADFSCKSPDGNAYYIPAGYGARVFFDATSMTLPAGQRFCYFDVCHTDAEW